MVTMSSSLGKISKSQEDVDEILQCNSTGDIPHRESIPVHRKLLGLVLSLPYVLKVVAA